MRWIGNQQLDVEIKVGNFIKVSLQHLAITQYPDPLAVVVHFIMNELFQLRPVLLIQAGNVVSVDVAEVGFNHGIFPVLLHGPCCKAGQGEVPQPRIASLKSNQLPRAIRRRLEKPSFAHGVPQRSSTSERRCKPSSTTSLSPCCTRRGGATRRPSRCAPWVRGRATGTCPRGRPVRAHRRNRRGRRRRPRARTRSCPASRARTWPSQFRTWPRTRRQAPGPASRPSRGRRAGSCIRRPPRAVAPR